MANAWTTERVLALAPDSSSASAGQGLSSAKKWTGLGQSERAVWGLCQGSGKDPYQARIDLSEPAFKCSCPSRKFPCKHGIGLMLLWAKEPAAVKTGAEPGWVSEWIESRTEKAEKKAEKAKEVAAKPPDPEAQAKRAAARESKVAAGVAELSTWLEDLVRKGLAVAKGEEPSWWERTAARMVDAQATGLAGLVRAMAEATASGAGWETRTLEVVGRTRLLLAAAEKLPTLPPDLAGDVRTALGWTQAKEDALGGEAVADAWSVVGQVTEDEERLRVRRTWLLGEKTGRRALVLDFAVGGAGNAALDASLIAGMGFDGELGFYPSRLPLRALVKNRDGAVRGARVGAGADATVGEALRRYAEGLAVNPWLSRWPVVLAGVRPARVGERWVVVDGEGAWLPVRPSAAAAVSWWRAVAATDGAPSTIAGEWDGEALLPLGVIKDGVPLVDVAPRWVA